MASGNPLNVCIVYFRQGGLDRPTCHQLKESMKVYQNIEIVQVNFDENTNRFYLPTNTNLYGRVINDISFYAAPAGMQVDSPFDGRQILTVDKLQNFYVEIVKDDKTVLHSKVSALLSDIAHAARIGVNSKVDLNLCSLTYVGDLTDLTGKALLCYFTFDTIQEAEYCPGEKIKAISISTAATNSKLSQLIDFYISAQGDTVKCIETKYDDSVPDNLFYLDLRDTAGRCFRLVPSVRFRISETTPSGGNNQYQKLYLADYNIDFKNSYIVRASTSGTMNVQLIFTY